ncbi:MAG: PIN domain-containing protein [Eggerthellaceae bacterium]|nr:PIN domain-containing protein [Eggerthellaceae bacterium]
MSKIMVDTNIWVDIVLNRPRFVSESKGAIMACLEDGDEVLIAATSLKDVFYFAAKSAGADAGYRAVELILEIAALAQVDGVVCRNAISLERPDYEDGIVAACLLAEDADAIITRDKESFNSLTVPKLAPGDFLSSRGYEPIGM